MKGSITKLIFVFTAFVTTGFFVGCTDPRSFHMIERTSSGVSNLSSETLVFTNRASAKQNNGWIDGVQIKTDGSGSVMGWACAQGYSGSIKVRLYLGGASGSGGTLVAEATANLPSEAAVGKACGSSGKKHRFDIFVPKATVVQYAGQKIYVHGINPFKKGNTAIGNSGNVKIPETAGSEDPTPTPSPTANPTPVRFSAIAVAGQDVTIAENTTVEIDTNVDIGKLTIHGQLLCPNTGDFTLRTTGVLVMGAGSAFRCGSANSRFNGTLKILLKGGLSESLHGAPPSDRNFMVMGGGTLELAGSLKNTRWLRLNKTAPKGASEIELSEAVEWSVGDEIAIAPTNYRYDEAEQAIVVGVSNGGKTIRLQAPLQFSHWGTLQTLNGRKQWLVDERAEVANLSRNIVIASEGDEATMDYRGGHVMVMAGAYAYVDAVEFFRLGRMGEMGRYPFHWHRAGNVSGQYIKNSSIHRSFQRCVTVHGTHNAEVNNNVCYNHFGHGYFLEDGDETGNKFIGNLGMLSKRPLPGRNLLASDIHTADIDRFPGPSTFWISNPNNHFQGNVAAGSQGTGFWNSFNKELYCEPSFCRKPLSTDTANVFPLKENTLLFDSNTAHSSEVGITWDGASDGELTNNPNNANDRNLTIAFYSPSRAPTFKNLGVYKNRAAAIYFRGDTAYFSNAVLADNKVGLFFAYNQVVTDSAVIAKTDNHTPEDYNYSYDFTGIRVYDGPFDLRNIDFINYPSEPIPFNGSTIIATPFSLIGGANRFTNVTQGLQFFPEPYRRFNLSAIAENVYPWADANSTPSIRDLDGSLAGKANSILVPDYGFNDDSSCVKIARTSGLRCDYQRGPVAFLSIRNNIPWENIPFLVKRSDGAKTYDSFDIFKDLPYNIKFGTILNKNYEYSVDFSANWSMPGKKSNGSWWPDSFQVLFQAEAKNQVSPVVVLNGLGQSCSVYSAGKNTWQKATSLENLRSKQVNSYFSSGAVLYLKMVATETNSLTPTGGSEFARQATSKGAMIQCN